MIDYEAVGGNANCFWSRCQLLWSCKNLVWRQWWRGGDSGATIFSYHHFLHLLHWSVSQSSQSNQRHSWIQGVLSLQGESNVFGSLVSDETLQTVKMDTLYILGLWSWLGSESLRSRFVWATCCVIQDHQPGPVSPDHEWGENWKWKEIIREILVSSDLNEFSIILYQITVGVPFKYFSVHFSLNIFFSWSWVAGCWRPWWQISFPVLPTNYPQPLCILCILKQDTLQHKLSMPS